MINLATENKVCLWSVVSLKFIAFNSATAHTLTVSSQLKNKHMSKLSFEIFKKVEDRYNWDKYIEFVEKTDDLDIDQKNRLIQAYLFFKTELGKGFLKNTMRQNHIVTNYVLQRGKEPYSWLIWLSDSLSSFKYDDCNYDKLLNKIRQVEKSKMEGIPFLEIADSYKKVGFEVVFEPLKSSAQKNPDLKVTNPETKEIFFIEISTLKISDDREKVSNIYHLIFEEFISGFVPFSGKILRRFDENKLNKILDVIRNTRRVAITENKFVTYRDKEIDFAFASYDRREELEKWCANKQYEIGNLLSLPININETKRILGNKLPKKALQIPSGSLGLVYIVIDSSHLTFQEPFELIEATEKGLKAFDNILGVCIYSKIGYESDNQGYFYKLHYYGNKTVFNSLRKDSIFVFNNHCKIQIFPNTIEKIYRTVIE